MRIKLAGKSIELIGDPHLGRRFEVGVPIARRGEREEAVMVDFMEKMNVEADMTICMGDIFDKFVVAPEIELFAGEVFNDAPNKRKFCLRGNHDASRDTNKKSSFDVFAELVKEDKGAFAVKENPLFWALDEAKKNCILMLPWHPFRNAAQIAADALGYWKASGQPKVHAAFGHWDTEDFSEFGGNTDNLVPLAQLRQMTDVIYTGHVHTPGVKQIGHIQLISVGSMQPYTHGEDPDSKVYETLTLKELEARDPKSLRDKCIRIELEEGEEAPPDIDALQVTIKRKKDKIDKAEEVRVDAFDLDRLYKESMEKNKVPKDASDRIKVKFEELKK
jgi:DNA repair exonuclease SbcCD nuclease subunit